ncbi:MAG: carbohydrate ABC transporter permease [Candidatus Omnitrophota bacterium]
MEYPIYYRIKNFVSKFATHILLISVSITCIFPLLWMFGSSLKTQQTIFSDMSLFPANAHWENFFLAWTKGNFGIYLFNSIFYTTIVVAGIVFIASLAAYGISRLKIPGKNIIFFIFLAAMMIPIPGSFISLYVLLMKLHLVNTRIGYILPMISQGICLGVYLLKTFFDKIPTDMEDLGRIDGCSKFGIYWHIALPLAKPAIAVIVIFNTLTVWNEYLLAMLVLNSKHLMPINRALMVFRGAHVTQYPLLMAGMTISVMPIIIMYLLLQKHIIKGITAGALKGLLLLALCPTLLALSGCARGPADDARQFPKGYFKDKVAASPGISQGVGPVLKDIPAEKIQDLGRREATEYDFGDSASDTLTNKAWEALNNKDEAGVLLYTDKCIELYSALAKTQSTGLTDYPPQANLDMFKQMDDIGACYFIRGEFFKYKKDRQKAKDAYQTLIDEYHFAQYWDPRGWYFKPAEIAKDEIKKIDEGYYN